MRPRPIRIHTEAAAEAERATAWYEKVLAGLGEDFENAVDAAMHLLECNPIPSVPAAGNAGKRGVRRLIFKRFPYDVVFVERTDYVWVLAFAHHRRRPAFCDCAVNIAQMFPCAVIHCTVHLREPE
jgi:toxin ParE1/3/4